MSDRESRNHLAAKASANLLELTELAVRAEDLEGLAQRVLPLLLRVTGVTGALLCLEEPKPPFHSLFHAGIQSTTLPVIKRICTEQFSKFPSRRFPHNRLAPRSTHLVLFFAQMEKRVSTLCLRLAAPANGHAEGDRFAGLFYRPIS
jgi:hypothetical protein